jgi:S-ribosylhomocysteine lyase
MMERIASFTVDHTKLERGIYLSRVDGDCLTFDLRMKKPNTGDVLETDALHTIEHIGATYLRNSRYGQQIIYFGPMGCRTGFYLVTRELGGQELCDLVVETFAFIADYEGEIPGNSPVECGNYRDLNLEKAKIQASRYLEAIEGYTSDRLEYQK